jgi:hypothetical protein
MDLTYAAKRLEILATEAATQGAQALDKFADL